jgi:AraC-like DNA-binding protein
VSQNSLFDPAWRAKGYAPQVEAYYSREWNDFTMPKQIHDRVEIMYINHGRCTMTVQDSGPFVLERGDLILIDASVVHGMLVPAGEPCRVLNVEFSFGPADQSCFDFSGAVDHSPALEAMLATPRSHMRISNPDTLYPLIHELVYEMDARQPETPLSVQLILWRLLATLARLLQAQQEASLPGSDLVRQALLYMQAYYDRPIHIADVADDLHINEEYFHRIFKRNMGVTPGQYLTQLRMDKARMLLARTDIQIGQLSQYVGIQSRQYFSTLFRKINGVSPQEYRRSQSFGQLAPDQEVEE